MKGKGMGPRMTHCGLLVLACLLAASAAWAAESAGSKDSCKDMKTQYRSDRAASVDDGAKQLQKAQDEAANRNFDDAVEICKAVQKQYSTQPGDDPADLVAQARTLEDRVRRNWSVDLMKKAHEQYVAKDYAKAIQLAGEAQQVLLSPSRTIDDFIEGCQAARDGADFRAATTEDAQVKAVQATRKETANLLREAKVFFANKRYEAAATSLERLLIVDPFNPEAMELLDLCYTKLFRIGTQRYEANRIGIQAANIWEWTEPISGFGNAKLEGQATTKGIDRNGLYNQMERIIFPAIDFQQTELSTVIRYLNRQSRIVDPDQKGVDIVLTSPEYAKRTIDVKLNNISMLDLLKLICQQANVSYSLQNNVVIIGARGKMERQTFEMRSEIVNKLCPNATGSGSGEGPTMDAYTEKSSSSEMPGSMGGMGGMGGMDTGIGGMGGMDTGIGGSDTGMSSSSMGSSSVEVAASAAAQSARDAALTKFFQDLGIEFSGEASLHYDYASGKLLVLNTMENLLLVEKIVQQLNERETYLVLIESKLLELNDTTLDELGFEWNFDAAPSSGEGSWAMSTGDDVIRTGVTEGTDTTYYRVVNGLKIFPNFGEKLFGSDVNVNLSLSIDAVSQNSNTEVLSSPRVLSNPGTPAMIEMVEETYFIEEWEAPDTDSDINLGLIGPEPDWGDMHPLGITFSVTPLISPNKQSITLKDLDVKFSLHSSDTHYPWTMKSWYYDAGGTKHDAFSATYDLKMPVITARRMKATLTVDDGATVMLGGLVDNKNQGRDDKWPFLGDIPFFGNFFRDQQSSVLNKTLVIFVTARIIHPNGEPKRSIENQGLVDFKR